MAQRLGLVKEIDGHRHLLKVHLPYHESDHMLNVAYNILAGGVRSWDWELRRQAEDYPESLGAPRIPGPVTVGDCTRRFQPEDILTLQECIDRTRPRVWSQPPKEFLTEGWFHKCLCYKIRYCNDQAHSRFSSSTTRSRINHDPDKLRVNYESTPPTPTKQVPSH